MSTEEDEMEEDIIFHLKTMTTTIEQNFSDRLSEFLDTLSSTTTSSLSPMSKKRKREPLTREGFLLKTIDVLSTRLKTIGPLPAPSFILDLFELYKFCLDKLGQCSLNVKVVLSLQVERLYQMLDWGIHEKVRAEELEIVIKLNESILVDDPSGIEGVLLPTVGEFQSDRDVAKLLVKIVVIVARLSFPDVGNDKTHAAMVKEVPIMVEEIQPWLKVLDSRDLEMDKIDHIAQFAQHVVNDLSRYDEDLVTQFIRRTLDWYKLSTFQDQMLKFCHNICKSLFSSHEESHTVTMNILRNILSSLACKCKDATGVWQVKFIDFVCYCGRNFRRLDTEFCSGLAECLHDLADVLEQVKTPTHLFIKLYSTTMSFSYLRNVTELRDIVESLEGIKTAIDSTPKDAEAFKVAFLNVWAFLCEPISDQLSAALVPSRMCETLSKFHEVVDYPFIQELLVYKGMKGSYSHEIMLGMIDILLRQINIKDDDCVEISRLIMKNTRALGATSNQGLNNNCNQCTEEAKTDISGKLIGVSARLHLLAMAHGLRVLYSQEIDPTLEVVKQDIEIAINLWLSILNPDVQFKHDTGCFIIDGALFMLFNIMDLLSLKCCREFNRNIYRLVIKISKWRKEPITKWLSYLWGSRRLSHALCISPIDDAFLAEMSCNCEENENPNNMDFWLSRLETCKASSVGFQLKLSLSSVDGVKNPSEVSLESWPDFSAANFHYDLCEKLITAGQLLKAMSYAKKAYDFRLKLFQDNFTDDSEVRNSVAIKLWSTNTTQDVGNINFTPWKVLQWYLESIHQVSVLYEMIGNSTEAMSLASTGQLIANTFRLPAFMVAFHHLLGKLYCRKGLWDKSEKELEGAKQFSCRVTCTRCRLMLEVSVDQQFGELYSSWFVNTKAVSSPLLSLAKGFYESARTKLKDKEWNICVTNLVGTREDMSCTCKSLKCCICLSLKVQNSKSLPDHLEIRWAFIHRRLSVGVLNGLETPQGMHNYALQSLASLFCRNTFQLIQKSDMKTIRSLMGEEFYRTTFSIQIAEVIYSQCLITLESDIKGTSCCLFELSEVVHWLLKAFVLCREVPKIFNKVSRLLSALYIISTSKELFSLPACDESLTKSHWASYFHQASLGTNLNYVFVLNKTEKMGEQISASASTIEETDYLIRVAPASEEELNSFVKGFFHELPKTTTIGISLLTGSLASLLQELLECSQGVRAWLLVSCLYSEDQPVVTLLPICSRLEGDDSLIKLHERIKSESDVLDWVCPWGRTITINEFAPIFEKIAEAHYYSLEFPSDHEHEMTYIERRLEVNREVIKFLRSLEDEWLGPWKSVFSARVSSSVAMDEIEENLINELESKCQMTVNSFMLKAILGAEENQLDPEACIQQLLSLKNGCFTGQPHGAVKPQTNQAVRLLQNAWKHVKILKEERLVNKEASILVLDRDVQMFPWETIPIFKSQEVYRLPTVGCTAWNKKSPQSSIDPFNAFYVSDPGGDLHLNELEEWFIDKKIKVFCKSPPSEEEWIRHLGSHDLYIYSGHGSGSDYISRKTVARLRKCAAGVLMGCSSGLLTIDGHYIPDGVSIDYLLAGSPFVVSALWNVSNRDCDRFLKTIWSGWEEGRDNALTVGSYMTEARKACRYKRTVAMVCYGIPTKLSRK